MTWPDPDVDYDLHPWDRQPNEPTRAYGAFRMYRDLPPTGRNLTTVAEQMNSSGRACRHWAQVWQWRERADAWDDQCHRTEDHERLEAIRSMHAIHRRAGRAALMKAMNALQTLDVAAMPPATIARMLELGAKLERSTLIVSVEELQGLDVAEADEEDPWERIARELTPDEPLLDDDSADTDLAY